MKRVIVILCLGMMGCGTVPSVRPIGKGQKSVTLSSGGPVTRIYGVAMPIPYSVLRYRQGLSDDTDFHLGIHPSMSMLGNLGIDVGLTRHLTDQAGWKPSFSLEASIYGFYHANELSSIRVYPEVSTIGSFRSEGREQVLYFGVQNMIQSASPYLVFVPLVGAELPFGRRFVLDVETKWYAPSEESEDRAVEYSIKPFGHGALGFAIGGSYKF